MAATSLPSRPDLERFRRDARALQRAVRTGHAEAIHLVAAHHPGGAPTDPATFPLSAAQLVTARRYGLSSWPKLVAYLRVSRVWSRDPVTGLDDSLAPADEFAALACLTYSELDDPLPIVGTSQLAEGGAGRSSIGRRELVRLQKLAC